MNFLKNNLWTLVILAAVCLNAGIYVGERLNPKNINCVTSIEDDQAYGVCTCAPENVQGLEIITCVVEVRP